LRSEYYVSDHNKLKGSWAKMSLESSFLAM